MSTHAKVWGELYKDRRLAHRILFHTEDRLPDAPMHGEMVDWYHDPKIIQGVLEAFRGAAKSTKGEEAVTIGAGFNDFWNCVIVGSTEKRAIERLAVIKHHFENNEPLIELHGEQVGDVWQSTKIVLKCGVCIQAVGVGQAVRGLKHLDWRPDFVWADDIEDEESVKTPESSEARMTWLYRTLIPICAKRRRIRVTGNRLSPHAVVTQLASSKFWTARRYPICYNDLITGEERATWPELHDMQWIRDTREDYESQGQGQGWASEYMCEATNEAVRPFKPEYITVVPRTRTYQPVQVMYDPAKTSSNLKHQAHTAKVVYSWIGRKLIIWDAWGKPLQPSELLDDIFKTENDYAPLSIHVEQDGLEEWLMEPLRFEQTKRGVLLPHLHGERAPRDKIAFIRMLQPYFASGDVECAENLPELRAQLLNFPVGRMDIVNALAYALKLRPGQPVYEGFTEENVSEEISANARAKSYLCMNGDGAYITGVLVQFDGTLSILGDWIEGGETTRAVDSVCKQAALLCGGKYDVVIAAKELDQYRNKGVAAALRRVPRQFTGGGETRRGRHQIQDFLGTRAVRPLLRINPQATWSLRSFAGGYARTIERSGNVIDEPAAGAYSTLMEGLESFAAIMKAGVGDGVGDYGGELYSVSRGGVMYKSMIGQPVEHTDSKSNYVRGI